MREYKLLSYFNMRALFMGVGIAKILNMSHEYTFLSIIIGTLAGILFLKYYRSSNNKSFISILVSLITIIISLFILINMVSSHYLPGMPKLIVSIPILLLTLYMASKSRIILYRLSSVLIYINIIIFILSIISLVPYFSFNSFTFTDTNIFKILLGGLYYFLLSITPTLSIKGDNYNLVKTYIYSSITLSIWMILTYGILGNGLVSILRYPEYVILKNVSLVGTLENIENFVSFMWIIDIVILIFSNVINIKENLVNKKYIYVLIPIIFFITAIINVEYYLLDFIYSNVIIIISILFLLNILSNKKAH